MIVRGIERTKWEIRNSRHLVLGTCEHGVYMSEGRPGFSVWAVDIDTFVGGVFDALHYS